MTSAHLNIFIRRARKDQCRAEYLQTKYQKKVICPLNIINAKYDVLVSVFFFCKLLPNGASYDTKIGCIQFLRAVAKKNIFFFFYVQALKLIFLHLLL